MICDLCFVQISRLLSRDYIKEGFVKKSGPKVSFFGSDLLMFASAVIYELDGG